MDNWRHPTFQCTCDNLFVPSICFFIVCCYRLTQKGKFQGHCYSSTIDVLANTALRFPSGSDRISTKSFYGFGSSNFELIWLCRAQLAQPDIPIEYAFGLCLQIHWYCTVSLDDGVHILAVGHIGRSHNHGLAFKVRYSKWHPNIYIYIYIYIRPICI